MPPADASPSYSTTSYPSGSRSRATVSEAGPAPISATRLPFFCAAGAGMRAFTSSLLSAATRFRRQMATGSAFLVTSSTRPRRHAGSHGRSQVRPNTPGKTLECQLTI